MLVERNRLLLAIKNFPLSLLMANPYWSSRRFAWHAFAALKQKGAAGQFIAAEGWGRMLLILLWSHLSAARILPAALVKRQKIQKTKTLSRREIRELLHRFQIDLRQLTFRD